MECTKSKAYDMVHTKCALQIILARYVLHSKKYNAYRPCKYSISDIDKYGAILLLSNNTVTYYMINYI